MAWDQLSIDKPHLAYIIIGGFTSLFMLCSLFIKERLYIGEATVATLCGVIFGPHAANLFDPGSWGNTDKITLELSRIVLVVQCFAVGVELPKAYMERHWRSVTYLLLPVMTFGWLITSLFVWWLVPPLTWLEGLVVAACVTATDPVLASSVVGKGKFAKRVPKHLRDVLSAESGCNDGAAFPFIYLSLFLVRYQLDAAEVTKSWFTRIILYQCLFGAIFGFAVGYAGRHAIKFADRRALIDRESFLVFYFVLALFCAGAGSLLGLDDLLVGFAAGVGFSNDGWFTRKTEETHVSNVIDLLLNLSYFVFLGSIIPWDQYNNPALGLSAWKLALMAILVILFRRIPIMLALKPFIPDVKNWREALFAGHFGPIGVGAIFAAILARAELETDSTEPLSDLPGPGSENYILIQVIWPIVTFLVISSILVHGSSIAVFTLGKHINTLTLTMSYTQGNDQSWMNRLPRVASRSKSMSRGRSDDEASDMEQDEKYPQFPPGTLPPIGLPGNFLRRQKEEENPSRSNSRASSLNRGTRRRKWDAGMGPGGPISQSAISPQWRNGKAGESSSTSPDAERSPSESAKPRHNRESTESIELGQRHPSNASAEVDHRERRRPSDDSAEVEVYEEGNEMLVEDEEGNILDETDIRGKTDEEKQVQIEEDRKKLGREAEGEHAKNKDRPHEKNEGEDIEHALQDDIEHPSHPYKNLRKRMDDMKAKRFYRSKEPKKPKDNEPPERHHGPAHAYQYGNTIIVEDEDGEVIKKYDMPRAEREAGESSRPIRRGIKRMGTWAGISGKDVEHAESAAAEAPIEGDEEGKTAQVQGQDNRIGKTMNSKGKTMSKDEFLKKIQELDPKARCHAIEESDAPEAVKQDARNHARAYEKKQQDAQTRSQEKHRPSAPQKTPTHRRHPEGRPQIQRVETHEDRPAGEDGLTLVDSNGQDIPMHPVGDTVERYSRGQPESAAQRRRRAAMEGRHSAQAFNAGGEAAEKSKDERPDSSTSGRLGELHSTTLTRQVSNLESPETAPERRRRLAALGKAASKEVDSEDDGSIREREGSAAGSGGGGGKDPEEETAAEKRRRLAALGGADGDESDSEDDGQERVRPQTRGRRPTTAVAEGQPASREGAQPGESSRNMTDSGAGGGNGGASGGGRQGIRFADTPAVSQGRVQWDENVEAKPRGRKWGLGNIGLGRGG